MIYVTASKAEQSAQQSAQLAEEALQASRQAQKAEQLAEFQLKANASLEEQLEYLQQRSSSLEMELLRSRAAAEATASAASERDALLSRLEAQQSEYGNTLKLREQSIAMPNRLNSKNTEIAGLTSKADQSEKQLLSLQGEYTELDQKYQKLLKPSSLQQRQASG